MLACFISLVPPRFTEIPDQVIKVKKNTIASVICRAFGFPPPVIQWSKAFASLPKRRATVENGTLKITSFSLKDVGTYQCKATNKLGSVSASTALNIVEGERNRLVLLLLKAGRSVRSSPDRVVQLRALVELIVWCSCTRHHSHHVSLHPGVKIGIGKNHIHGGVEIPLAVSCYSNRRVSVGLISHLSYLARMETTSFSTVISFRQLLSFLSRDTGCPDGWVRHTTLCFRVIDSPTLKWNFARRTCQDLAADLAIIRSVTENNFIFDLIRKQKTVTN